MYSDDWRDYQKTYEIENDVEDERYDLVGMYFLINGSNDQEGIDRFPHDFYGQITAKGEGFYVVREYWYDVSDDHLIIRGDLEIVAATFIADCDFWEGSGSRIRFFPSRDDFLLEIMRAMGAKIKRAKEETNRRDKQC